MRSKVLLIEDEKAIHKLIKAALSGEEYELTSAFYADEGIRTAATIQPDLILLDIGLPEKSGFEVLKSVREWSTTPIIILSARSDEQSKILALDNGANDYVTKPFSTGELLARIRASLRFKLQSKEPEKNEIICEPFFVDVAAHIIKKNNEELHLTPTEFRLLLLLMKNVDRVISHRQLLKDIWGPGFGTDVQYLRVFMKQLRQKIEDIPSEPKFIVTEPGIGYRFKGQNE